MAAPPPMTVSLTRVEPAAKTASRFQPEQYMNDLTASLSAREPEMHGEITAGLRHALSSLGLSDAQLSQGLETLCRRIKETPLHIGFVCDKKFVNESGQFWASGRYFNRPLWYQQKGYIIPHPRSFEPVKAAPEHQPIYGALNLGMSGHSGWGASYFVLKPSACKCVELRSRDTGEPDGIGAFAMIATRDKPLPLIADWIRMGTVKKMWSAMVEEQRAHFFIPPNINTEAAIYTENGYVSADDVALIMVSKKEAVKNGIDVSSLEQLGQVHGIPVICHDADDSTIPFDQLPEYQRVLADYRANAAV
jgi:hypothetical protein